MKKSLRQIKAALEAGDRDMIEKVIRHMMTREIQLEQAFLAYSETQPTHLYRCQIMVASLESSVFERPDNPSEDDVALYESSLDDIKLLLW